jgi:hypothetical protein
MREGYFCGTDSAVASITAATFADCSSLNIRIALPYPLDGGTKLRTTIALGCASERRQLWLGMSPRPGYVSTAVLQVQLTL